MQEERGAVAVIVALCMVVLLGITALVIDVGGIYVERRQLQNGADAAALAVAQNCAAGNCGSPSATALSFAGKNANDGASQATTTVDTAAGTVTVKTGVLTASGAHVLTNTFAAIVGVPTSTVSASAKASWGSPSAAVVFPFTIAHCIYNGTPANTERWITTDNTCTDDKGNVVPGGFGWLDESGNCAANVDILVQVGSDPGKSAPPCDKSKILNTTILLPIYSTAQGQGQNATYTVYGFAAFKITDASWPGNWTTNPSAACDKCTGIKGSFIRLVSLDTVAKWSVSRLGGPTLNASFVSLSQ
ncbi:pilus assembly protein TadG-related protein [Tersicoccus sp. MR15.9]|uniref:pilus assembly protein TadG-related protein n=1 Tax=Tersicoccus mangrovi TaxID=3121635 RepID=UPI002FE535C8